MHLFNRSAILRARVRGSLPADIRRSSISCHLRLHMTLSQFLSTLLIFTWKFALVCQPALASPNKLIAVTETEYQLRVMFRVLEIDVTSAIITGTLISAATRSGAATPWDAEWIAMFGWVCQILCQDGLLWITSSDQSLTSDYQSVTAWYPTLDRQEYQCQCVRPPHL